MTAKTLHNPVELRKLGIKALTEALGPIGMARFLGQFEEGKGDYTKERDRLFKGKSVAALMREIKKK